MSSSARPEPADAPAKRTGRRPGTPDTRGEILDAARQLLAERSPSGVTVRAVAARAGVDPALVHHYFGTKRSLFTAALELPFDPRMIVRSILDGPVAERGERMTRTFFGVWEDPSGREPFLALLRSALSAGSGAGLLAGFIQQVMLPLAEHEAGLDGRRVELAVSHLVGIAVLRYLIAVEPLASTPVEELVAAVAPSVQRYLAP
ncbi:transcriptional regulator, TetR family [Beutenbergia cavernae DSM 12333]|uniref:Transcriptional regulator, TetR family n=1 Tax=Beutenbergia cavernae (strain ATCC BAA-8 / DSM 12333 / CCUG 43141 / JCM 11478 / NBRC 16432 / NCIMB 13614 / HKI 0122) TaxID=471853 RepID=C5C328_BEUC1|nr:TetR family transcriptional regulator [Beutenbergia cavernae]ACQ81872.1 transcriptional regulator, TetR family [Beutenbergia cavernae DSM 12333]